MDKINYLDIVKKAAAIAWKHKYLWWFGFFASLTSTGGFLNYSFDRNAGINSEAGRKFTAFLSDHLELVILAAFILLILYSAFLILGIIGRGALIKSIGNILNPSAGEASDFKTGLKQGKKYFWRIFVIGIVLAAFIFAAMVILVTPIVFFLVNKSYLFAISLILIAIAILIPLAILSVYLRTFGYIYAVLGELKAWAAIESAYLLFRKNLGVSIILGLIFMLIGIIYGLSLLLLFVPIAAAFFILGSFLYLALKGVGIAIAAGLGALVILSLVLFLRSIYETFAQAVWILFFHEIAKPKAEETVAEELEEMKSVPAPNPAKSSEVS